MEQVEHLEHIRESIKRNRPKRSKYLSQEKEIKEKNKDDNNDKINDNDNDNNRINNNLKTKNNNKNLENNEYDELDHFFNKVEKVNAKKLLKGNLAEIYNEIMKSNVEFKNNIFFVNLNKFENEVGRCDRKIISHSFKKVPDEYILNRECKLTDELMKKYIERAKKIKNENEF